VLVYILLNIIVKGKRTILVPQEINSIAFAIVITQRLENINNLALAILVGPVILKLSKVVVRIFIIILVSDF
jgi:hypothetical protein